MTLYPCSVCKDRDCKGCEEEDYAPEGRPGRPPVLLQPLAVLRMRRQLERYKETGVVDWLPWRAPC